ncbi:hypothetical protein KC368_g2 [Hortaea werneckii]|nr:hypothetical protein KC368_g2 [Hortaea werneckii]
MSPTSSTTSVPSSKTMAPPPRPSHSRHTSVASGKQQLPPQQHLSQTASKAPSPRPKPEVNKPNVHYTCFIRLPFQRNGFEDPPPQGLQPLRAGLGCHRRKVRGMRKVMKMGAGVTGSNAPSPVPLEDKEVEIDRTTDSHVPSAINTLKAAPSPLAEGSSPVPGTPLAGQSGISRTPSTTTVTQSKQLAGSGDKQPFQRAFRTSKRRQAYSRSRRLFRFEIRR